MLENPMYLADPPEIEPTETWQFIANDSILNEKYGPVFVGARKNSRGRFLAGNEVPDYVRWFLNLQEHDGRWHLFDFVGLSTADMRSLPAVRWQRRDPRGVKGVFEIPVPQKPPKPRKIPAHVPAIRSLADLCDYFSAESPALLNKRIYKGTDCGASIGVYLPDGKAIHNGDREWETLGINTPIRGFTIQTIVEGSDATVDSDEFTLPVTHKEVDTWIKEMESQASDLWKEANDPLAILVDRLTDTAPPLVEDGVLFDVVGDSERRVDVRLSDWTYTVDADEETRDSVPEEYRAKIQAALGEL